MARAKKAIEQEFLGLVSSGELVFRPFELEVSSTQPGLRELDFDGVLTLRREPDFSRRFCFDCTSTWSQQHLLRLVQAREKLRASEYLPLLVVPYLSDRHLDQLDEAGVSGLDLSGNGLLQALPTFYVRKSGARNKYKLDSPASYIYRSWKLSSVVPRIFVSETFFPAVQTLRDECHARMMPLGTAPLPLQLPAVSKALARLEEDLVIERRGREIRLIDPERLLDGLARAYKPPRTSAHFVGRTALSTSDIWKKLATLRAEVRTIATGRSSAPMYTDLAGPERLSLYVSDARRVAVALDAKPTTAFPNLELLETDEEGVYFDARRDADTAWSSVAQTFLEISVGGAREVEVSRTLRATLLARLEHGRAPPREGR